MLELRGKNGTAKVFTDIVDDATISQVIGIMNAPITENSKVRIMPDCHAGSGCVIGTTMELGDKVCPNIVGVDIGCGMLVVNLGKIEIDLPKFDDICHTVPSGNAVNDDYLYWKGTPMKDADSWMRNLKCYYSLHDVGRLCCSLGSLGGGNHFIELDKDDDGNIYLVIHSGSRNLGLQVATYYQKLAIKKLHDNRAETGALITKLKSEGREKEIETELKKLKEKNPAIPDEMAYLEGSDRQDYLDDMKLCQIFADWSRKMMAKKIIESYFGQKIQYKDNYMNCGKNKFEVFQTIHNYINFNDNILRKGAVSAAKGETLIIPMNMRDGSLICIGKGNEDWNESAPHGAGRIMSRAEAKQLLDIEEYEDAMKGIYSTTVNKSTIDEAPMVYKPMESIIENVKDTVDIINIIKPIYNFKAAEETPEWLKEKLERKEKNEE